MDNNFLLAPNPLKRIEDINIIYSTGSEAIALKLLKNYNVKYIYFSDNAQKLYEDKLKYVEDKIYFKKVRGRIYEVINY